MSGVVSEAPSGKSEWNGAPKQDLWSYDSYSWEAEAQPQLNKALAAVNVELFSNMEANFEACHKLILEQYIPDRLSQGDHKPI